MTSEEPKNSPPTPESIKSVFETWTLYGEQTENMVHLTHEGFARIQQIPKMVKIIEGALQRERDDRRRSGDEWKADIARQEADAGFPILHAHSLLGLWGALECFVEDLFIALLDEKPGLLAGDAFAKVKLPVAVLVSTDSQERLRAILTETTRSTNSDVALGVTKFERLLKLVELSGQVPPKVGDAVFVAQQVRNVWAHRGGIADSRFVERCPTLGFVVGERVDMRPGMFGPLMHGLHMYGVVVCNRYLKSVGRDEIDVVCPGYEGVLDRPKSDALESAGN